MTVGSDQRSEQPIECFDALDPAIRRCPWPHYEWLQKDPSRRVYKLPFESNFYLVHRREDVLAVLADPQTFSSQVYHDREVPFFPMMSGSEHQRVRGVVQSLFTPASIRALEPRIAEIALARTQMLVATERCDLMESWASPIALAVIARMLGMDASAANLSVLRRQATALNIEAFPVGGTGERNARAQPASERLLGLLRRVAIVLPRALRLAVLLGASGTIELARYVGSKNVPPDTPRQFVSHGDAVEREALIIDLLVQFARLLKSGNAATPDEAVVARFAAAQHAGRISAVESMMACLIILLAGYGTTSSLLACAVHRLATTPGLLPELAHDPGLMDGFVEELLRYYGPLQRTARRTTRSVNLGGVELPKNAQLIVALGAANVDPARFERPARFDPKRQNANQHIAFGRGIHVCLGAALARVQARVALLEFVRRVRHVEVDAELAPSYIVSRDTGMYGFESLFVRVSGH